MDNSHTAGDEEHKARERRHWSEMFVAQWAMVFVTAFAFAAAATAAYWGWRLDVIAAGQKDLAARSLEIAEATERAYVNTLVKPFVIGNVADAVIDYKNTGVTPAKDLYLTITSGFSAATPANYKSLLPKCETMERGAVIPPGVLRHIDTLFFEGTLPPNIQELKTSTYLITPKLYNDITSAAQIWTVGAWIRYHDQFNRCHATFEPFFYNPSSGQFDPALQGFEQIDK